MDSQYTDALERALGRVLKDYRAEAQRQLELMAAKTDAAIAELHARKAEFEIKAANIDREIDDRVARGIAAGLAAITANLARQYDAIEERVATVETRQDEWRAPDPPDLSGLATRDDLDALRSAIPAIPEQPDLSGFATSADIDAVRAAQVDPPDLSGFATRADLDEVRGAIPSLPPAVDVSCFATIADLEAVRSGIPNIPPAPDLSVFATKEDVDAVRGAIPTVPEPKDWSGDIEAAVSGLRDDVHRVRGEVTERLARHPGVFPVLLAWVDAVHYAGDVVTHGGSMWQARRDTGREPPHDDWECIVAKGDRGEPGPSIIHRGTWSPDVDDYRTLDVAVVGGSSFLAVCDDPGQCPGDGWRLLASRGATGKPGVKGDQGRPGKDAHALVAADVDDEGKVRLTSADGSTVELDLYPALSKVS